MNTVKGISIQFMSQKKRKANQRTKGKTDKTAIGREKEKGKEAKTNNRTTNRQTEKNKVAEKGGGVDGVCVVLCLCMFLTHVSVCP